MIRHAVVLAAGGGIRLGSELPKTLTDVGGRPLLSRILAALAQCGVEVAHVVTGAQVDPFTAALPGLSGHVEVRLVACPDWQLGNGRSAAAAEALVPDDRFFLVMGDHLIGADHLRCVAAAPAAACALGTSPIAPWIDIADATKVSIVDGFVRDIGKELERFDGIDTGVFAMTRAIFPALEEARRAGEYSLTAGNRRLCARGMLASASIGDLRWQDVDTPADRAAAEAWIARGLV